MNRWKFTKCRHFNRLGEISEAWGLCPKPRDVCPFIHPEDPEWEDYRGYKPPSYLRPGERDRGWPERDRDFGRERSDRDRDGRRTREQDWERDWERDKNRERRTRDKDATAPQGYQRTRADSIASSRSNASMAVDRADKPVVRSDSLSSKPAPATPALRTSPSKTTAVPPSKPPMAPPPTISTEKASTALPALKSTPTAPRTLTAAVKPTAQASTSQVQLSPPRAPSSSLQHVKQLPMTAPPPTTLAPNPTPATSADPRNLPPSSSNANTPQIRPAPTITPASTLQQTAPIDITTAPVSESPTIPGLGSATAQLPSTENPTSQRSMLPPNATAPSNPIARIRTTREIERAENRRLREENLQQQKSEAQLSSNTASPPPRPPPPPPPPPDLEPPKAPPADQAISADAKLKIWTERIKLIADALSCEDQITDLTTSLAELSTYSTTPNFVTDPGERKEIDENLKELKTTRETAKQRRQKIVDSLLGKTDLWPTTPSFQEVEARNEEIKKQVKELAVQVQSIKDWYAKLKTAHTDGGGKETLKRKRKETSPDAMEVDSDPSEVSEEEAEVTATNSVGTDHLKVFRKRLQSLEQFYGELENDMFQAIEMQTERFREKVGDLMLEKQQFEEDLVESQQNLIASHASDLKARLTETEERTTSTKNDLQALDKEVSELKTRLNDLERERKEKQEAEDTFFKVELPALNAQLQVHANKREETDRGLRALQEALEAYKNRPPPTPPATPSVALTAPEYVMRALDDILVERTRQHIRPMMEDTRNRIEDMTRAQSTELYTTMWGKLEMTRTLVDRLHAIVTPGTGVKMDPGTSPVDGSVPSSTLRNG